MPELRRAAWTAFAAHLLAGIAMAVILRHGLDTNPDLAARMRFISEHRVLWVSAWLAWNAAALSILWFYVSFAGVYGAPGIAVPLAVAAVAADLGAEAIEMGLLPALSSPEDFLAWHRACVMLTGYLANGLYTLVAVLLAWGARRTHPAWVSAFAAGVGVFGLWLSLAALAGSVPGMLWSNAGLLPCLLGWLAGVATRAKRITGTPPPSPPPGSGRRP